jgi:hypothetical protein
MQGQCPTQNVDLNSSQVPNLGLTLMRYATKHPLELGQKPMSNSEQVLELALTLKISSDIEAICNKYLLKSWDESRLIIQLRTRT